MSGSLRVLIVDDNAAVRMILSDMLADLGHQVVAEAENQTAALKAYNDHKPDVVTLDLSLSAIGGADGISVLKSIREIDKNAKVIVISGNAQTKVKEQVTQLGASAFVSKPIKMDELTSALAATRSA